MALPVAAGSVADALTSTSSMLPEPVAVGSLAGAWQRSRGAPGARAGPGPPSVGGRRAGVASRMLAPASAARAFAVRASVDVEHAATVTGRRRESFTSRLRGTPMSSRRCSGIVWRRLRPRRAGRRRGARAVGVSAAALASTSRMLRRRPHTGGGAGTDVDRAAECGGAVPVPFRPGRTDADIGLGADQRRSVVRGGPESVGAGHATQRRRVPSVVPRAADGAAGAVSGPPATAPPPGPMPTSGPVPTATLALGPSPGRQCPSPGVRDEFAPTTTGRPADRAPEAASRSTAACRAG